MASRTQGISSTYRSAIRSANKYPDPPDKDIGEGLRTVRSKMLEAKLKEPEFAIEDNYCVVRLGHTPLGRPEKMVLEYW